METKIESVVDYLSKKFSEHYVETETLTCTADESWYLDAFFFYWCDVLGREV